MGRDGLAEDVALGLEAQPNAVLDLEARLLARALYLGDDLASQALKLELWGDGGVELDGDLAARGHSTLALALLDDEHVLECDGLALEGEGLTGLQLGDVGCAQLSDGARYGLHLGSE